jgi:hypothetical protein
LRDKYQRDWSRLKRARFNAAERLTRKQNASTYSLAIAGICAFLLPLFTLQFADALTAHTKHVLEFTANVTGTLSLVMGLIEQARDYPARARRFHECGLAVNSVIRDLSIASSGDSLKTYIERYEAALSDCDENHTDLDSDIARAQDRLYAADEQARHGELTSQVRKAKRELLWLRRYETFQIYCLYAIIWCVPPMTGVGIWFAMRPA